MKHKDKFSPWYNPNKPDVVTGEKHKWESYFGVYYGSTYRCSVCNKTNVGWHLWKEDFLLTCSGKRKVQ